MARPGTTITRSSTRPARSARTSTGAVFAAGMTGTVDTDPLGPRKSVVSLSEYATRFGSRTAHGANPEMYDFAEFFFGEGGSEMFVSRTADAVDATLTAALALFTRDLGPGQVVAPQRITATQRLILAQHARDNNRLAVLAATNTAVTATLTADATIAGVDQASERAAAMFAPWVTVPGVGGVGTRTIGPEAIVCGIMSKNDGLGVSQNQASAGSQYGTSDKAVGVTQSWDDTTRTTINVNSVNVLRYVNNAVRVYGYRSLADPTTDPNYVNLGNVRLFMAIQAQADAVAERFVYRQIDGQGQVLGEFGGAIAGILLPYWAKGSLYGATPEQSFKVDVGPNVNTSTTIANRELHASIAVRMSEFAEEVFLDIVKVATTETV